MIKMFGSVCIDAPASAVWERLARLGDIQLCAQPIRRSRCRGARHCSVSWDLMIGRSAVLFTQFECGQTDRNRTDKDNCWARRMPSRVVTSIAAVGGALVDRCPLVCPVQGSVGDAMGAILAREKELIGQRQGAVDRCRRSENVNQQSLAWARECRAESSAAAHRLRSALRQGKWPHGPESIQASQARASGCRPRAARRFHLVQTDDDAASLPRASPASTC
jgi:hypothetical protein